MMRMTLALLLFVVPLAAQLEQAVTTIEFQDSEGE